MTFQKQQIKDYKTVMRIAFFIILLFCIVSASLSFKSYSVNIVLSFFVLFFLTLLLTKKWFSTISLFFVFIAISCVIGLLFFEYEKAELHFNPYILIVGLLMLCLGYFIGLLFSKIKKKKLITRRRELPAFALYFTFCLSTIAFLFFFLKNIGILSQGLQNGRLEASSGNGALVYAFLLHIVTIPLLFLKFINKKMKLSLFLLLYFLASLQLILFGFRTPFVVMNVIILMILLFKGKINFKIMLFLAIVVALFAFAYGIIRNGTTSTPLFYKIRSIFTTNLFNLNRVFYVFPKEVDFQYGDTYLINFRMLMPGPDADFTLWLKENLNMDFDGGGVTPTIFGEFYLNFGYPGIFIGMFLFGLLLNLLDYFLYSNSCSIFLFFWCISISTSATPGIANNILEPILFGLYYGSFYLIFGQTSLPHRMMIVDK